jgi:hypothetical protein
MKPPPPAMLDEVDQLFNTLSRLTLLLSVGRGYGLEVGLSDHLMATMHTRHGNASQQVTAGRPDVRHRQAHA